VVADTKHVLRYTQPIQGHCDTFESAMWLDQGLLFCAGESLRCPVTSHCCACTHTQAPARSHLQHQVLTVFPCNSEHPHPPAEYSFEGICLFLISSSTRSSLQPVCSRTVKFRTSSILRSDFNWVHTQIQNKATKMPAPPSPNLPLTERLQKLALTLQYKFISRSLKKRMY